MNPQSKHYFVGGPDCPHFHRQWLPGPVQGTSIKMPCAEALCSEAAKPGTLYLAGKRFYRTTKYDPKRIVWEELK